MTEIKTFPKLFKLNSGKKLLQWEISVSSEIDQETGDTFGVIKTDYGMVDGKIQSTSDTVKKGKNIGKNNETSAWEQAVSEAQSNWNTQISIKGYVEDKERALADQSDRGSIEPMLAHEYKKHKAKIQLPVALQPKLDGIRCLAVVTEDKVELYSRNGKPITAVPHIQEQVLKTFSSFAPITIDGELYNHALKTDFEKIVSLVRKQKEIDENKIVEYHIYDFVNEKESFLNRFNFLKSRINTFEKAPHLVLVDTLLAKNEAEITSIDQTFVSTGYEGSMLRNLDSYYEPGKRSFHLQKLKSFLEAEFPIIGFEEGRGKLAACVASFICQLPKGKSFKAKMEGTEESLQEFFFNHDLWSGKKLTVKFQDYTNQGIPRFPVGKAIRDYE